MKLDKVNFIIALIILTIIIPPYLVLSLFLPFYVNIATLFSIFILYTIVFSTVIFYLFVRDNRKCSNIWSAFRSILYYRGLINMIFIPYVACFLFLFLIFQYIISDYLPLNTMYIPVILSLVVTIFFVSTFHIMIKKKEKSIIKENKKIEERTNKIFKEVERTFKNQG